MSTSVNLDVGGNPDTRLGDPANGRIGDKPVVEAKNQTTKAWFIVAVVAGSLVALGVGGFGTIGLLQSHNLISLPQSFQWLTSAIGVVGNTPHMWTLWAMAVGGVAIGGGLIAFGAYKIHKARVTEEMLKMFDNNLASNLDAIYALPTNSYRTNYWSDADKDSPNRKCYTIIKTPEGVLKCTDIITEEQSDDLEAFLETQGYLEEEARQASIQAASQQLKSMLFDDCNGLEIGPHDYDGLRDGTYVNKEFGIWKGEGDKKKFVPEDRSDRYYTVIKIPQGPLKYTARMNKGQRDDLEKLLRATGAVRAY